ncbi:DNA-3-methyladenine glycosylase family protein [Bernardetia sp.]|uniref:DNA-3-methyladenine glycosylase family protein n=1 Tax=Bernardetia sp. TaxID=1937974 RepID=UPI0025B86124|nr:DNA-3-methyladenine glycosylase 2 family protein [Bernardetia sp.]
MLQKAKTHLYKDPLFAPILETVEISTFGNPNSEVDIMASLIKAIISQQLSVKAAATIYKRFLDLFDGVSPNANTLLKTNDEVLRSVGLSKQKITYVREVALFSQQNDISMECINQKTDEQVIEYLSQIKGVGRWTVEMLLMFTLHRPDVFPLADLGIQQAMQKLLQTDEKGKDLLKQMKQHAEKWKPYRTIAALYLWKWKDISK